MGLSRIRDVCQILAIDGLRTVRVCSTRSCLPSRMHGQRFGQNPQCIEPNISAQLYPMCIGAEFFGPKVEINHKKGCEYFCGPAVEA
jgi:hypothetical protein